MSRALAGLGVSIIVLAPFREGGRDPLGLLLLHTLVLLFALISFLRAASTGAPPPGPARTVAGLGATALLLAAISSLSAGYPLAACFGLLDLAAGAGLFVAALAARPAPFDLRLMGVAVVLSTSLQAALGLLRFAGGGGAKAAGAGFLNPNHLAAFLNLGLLLSVAAADAAWDRGDHRRTRLWAGSAALHLAAAAILASRGALLGLGAALSVFVALRFRAWNRARRAAALAALAVALLAAGGLVARRFAHWQDPLRYQRLAIWRAASAMLAERPLLGHGPGMFRHLSAAYNVPLDLGPIRYERRFASAHSAPLTLAVEDGAPAAACLLAAAVMAAVLLLRARGQGPPGLAFGLGLALVALLSHAAVEDLQERPALVLVPALLAGSLLGAGRAGPGVAPGERDGRTALERRSGAPRPAVIASALTAATVAFAGAVLLPYLADHEARAAHRQDARGLTRMERAARLNPLHPEYRHDLAMAALNSGPPTAERYAEAALHLVAARHLKPIDHRFPLLLARLEAGLGERLFSDATAGARAAALYAEAAALAPRDPRPLLEMAGHLARLRNHRQALEAVAAALRLEPNLVRARILEASILADLGRTEEAEAAFARLIETEHALRGFVPESGYASDLARSAPEERRSLEARLGPLLPGRGTAPER